MSDIEEINKFVKETGNNFHHKVLKCLKDKGWFVQISPYYNDFVSEKPREIDLIAENIFKVDESNVYKDRVKGLINVRLFIECKYIPDSTEIVFSFYDKDIVKAEERVTSDTGLSSSNRYALEHHYLKGNSQVAKLFAHRSNSAKGEEKEIFYKALNQCLNATISLRSRKSIIPHTYVGDYPIKTVDYPVIVCNSFKTFYRLNMETEEKPFNIEENFQLEVNYAFIDKDRNQKDEYFLIDIIKFERLDNFLRSLEPDIFALKIKLEKS